MPLYVVGLNAKTHSVDEREKFALLDQQIVKRNQKLIDDELLQEIVTISTCNRVEHYFVTDNPLEDVIPTIFGGIHPKSLFCYKNYEASHHLFQVTSGLDSQILGENEIIGQVKKSYFLAQENGLTKRNLNILFQKAIYVGKRVRTITDISKCSVSTGGIVIDKIKHHFDDLSQITVLLVGAGEISRSVAMSLYQKGVKNILISNRSKERGESLANEMEANYIPITNFYPTLKKADVIVSSTTAPHYVITNSHSKYFTSGKKIMFDLAVPRDIEQRVGNYDNIKLYNIDDITTLSDLNKSKREKEVLKSNSVVAVENCYYCISNQLNGKEAPAGLSFLDFKQFYKTHKKSGIV